MESLKCKLPFIPSPRVEMRSLHPIGLVHSVLAVRVCDSSVFDGERHDTRMGGAGGGGAEGSRLTMGQRKMNLSCLLILPRVSFLSASVNLRWYTGACATKYDPVTMSSFGRYFRAEKIAHKHETNHRSCMPRPSKPALRHAVVIQGEKVQSGQNSMESKQSRAIFAIRLPEIIAKGFENNQNPTEGACGENRGSRGSLRAGLQIHKA